MPRRNVRDNLWTLIIPPLLWATHFLVSYIVVAIGCAKAGSRFATIDGPRTAIAVVTLIVLVLIGNSGRRAWREWRRCHGELPHDRSAASQRERLLEFASVLLAALSFVAVVFVALPIVLFADCR